MACRYALYACYDCTENNKLEINNIKSTMC